MACPNRAERYDQDAQARRAGDPILDDPVTPPDAQRPAGGTPPPSSGSQPPSGDRGAPKGLRDQLKATVEAAIQVVRAHVALARAELGEIAQEGMRVGILAGIALGLLLFAGLLLPVGLTLFLGEWLFGSIGWGVLLGTELAIGGALVLVFAALYVPGRRIGSQLLVALVAGLIVAVLLGLDLPHQAFSSIGSSAFASVDPGPRPLIVGLFVGVIVGAIVGIVVGLGRRSGAGGTVAAAIGLGIIGLALGAIAAIDFRWHVAIALGLALALALWPALVGIDTYRRGLDLDGLKNRFYPRLTIETTKETIEWGRKQRPLGPKS